eukprot:scaffold1355_cov268-Pinguiococcus_pyrenoidosus.AAC.57
MAAMRRMRVSLLVLLCVSCQKGQGLRSAPLKMVSGSHVSRGRAVVGGLGGLALLAGFPWTAAAGTPRITAKVQLDLSVVKDFQATAKEPVRLVLGLYGNEAPEATSRTTKLATEASYDELDEEYSRPTFEGTIFLRNLDGVIEMGTVKGISEDVDDKGDAVLLYRKKRFYAVPAEPERNSLKHDRAGLLTRSRYASDPAFGISMEASAARDEDGLVFGEVIDELSTPGWLEKLRSIPVYSDGSMEPEGSIADEVFRAQRKFFRGVAKAAKDTRAEDRQGLLLRRVTVTGCKVLDGNAAKLSLAE